MQLAKLILSLSVISLLGLLLVSSSNTSSADIFYSWPMPGHDPQRTCCAPYSGPDKGILAWSLKLPGVEYSNIVSDNTGNIYVASKSKIFFISSEGQRVSEYNLPRSYVNELFLLDDALYCIEIEDKRANYNNQDKRRSTLLVEITSSGTINSFELPYRVEPGWNLSFSDAVLYSFNYTAGIYAYDLHRRQLIWHQDFSNQDEFSDIPRYQIDPIEESINHFHLSILKHILPLTVAAIYTPVLIGRYLPCRIPVSCFGSRT